MNRPVCFVDLDDTLFQTSAKLQKRCLGNAFSVAAVDQSGQPRSVMTKEQNVFVDWLLSSTRLIPVTARGTEELNRVNIPFYSWRIAAHGGVIITPKGGIDRCWQNVVCSKLGQYRAQLEMMYQLVAEKCADDKNINVKLCREYGNVPMFVSLKLNSASLERAKEIQHAVEQSFDLDGFEIHHNENNIHWLPLVLDKGHAVKYLLTMLKEVYGEIPVLGFGDSINDYGFLQHCSWFGSPRQSQIASLIQKTEYA